jgi:dolichol-phosphate mannosyltransferase
MIAPAQLHYSVVIPFFNEAAVARAVVEEVCAALATLDEQFEVVAVDDGSRDATVAELERAAAQWPQCRIVRQSPNAGQAAALLRGFAEARAPIIITLDGDGQNVPADIPRLLPLLAQADMVVGVRTTRRDSWLRRRMSRLANRVRARVLGDGLSDSGCALKVFRREVAGAFWPIRSLYSFMPAFAVAAGFRVTEIRVQHRERRGGESKYGLWVMLWRPLADMLALWWLLRRRGVRRNR